MFALYYDVLTTYVWRTERAVNQQIILGILKEIVS